MLSASAHTMSRAFNAHGSTEDLCIFRTYSFLDTLPSISTKRLHIRTARAITCHKSADQSLHTPHIAVAMRVLSGLLAVLTLLVACHARSSPPKCAIIVDSAHVEVDAYRIGGTTVVNTLHDAQVALRRLLAEQEPDTARDIFICVSPGKHSLVSAPLHLTTEDSPRFGTRVLWRGLPGDEPVVITGGVQVTGWAPEASRAAEASVTGIPTTHWS